MSILGSLFGGILGGGSGGGGSSAPKPPEVPYSDIAIPRYSDYASPVQDPLSRMLLSEYMGDLGYDTSYGQPSPEIDALQQRYDAGQGQQPNLFEGRDPTTGLAHGDLWSEANRLGIHDMPESERQQLMVRMGLAGRSGSMNVQQGRDLLSGLAGRRAGEEQNALLAQIQGLQGQSNTPTFTRREGFDPNAELNRYLTLGRNTIDQLYDENEARAQQALRGSAQRRGLYRSGMANREQRELAARTMQARSQSQMDYGQQLAQAQQAQRMQRLGAVQGLLGNAQQQQAQSYGSEAGARRDAGNYSQGLYSNQVQQYNQQQQEQQRRREQMTNIFTEIPSLFSNNRNSNSITDRAPRNTSETGYYVANPNRR